MKVWQFGMMGAALFFAVEIYYLATHVKTTPGLRSISTDELSDAKFRAALNQILEENRGNPYFQLGRKGPSIWLAFHPGHELPPAGDDAIAKCAIEAAPKLLPAPISHE